MVSPLDSAITASTYTDPELAALFSDGAEIDLLLQVEAQLALVQEELGIIPAGSGRQIADILGELELDPAAFAAAYRRDGLLVPALVKAVGEQLPPDLADYLHLGVTSQDIMDTGLALQLQAASAILAARLEQLLTSLADLAANHRDTLMLARTRGQAAAPTVFGLKVAGWLAPLLRQGQRLRELSPRLNVVQLGGAVGTLAALGPRGLEVQESLARALGLATTAMSWHGQRDNLVEFANWLSLGCGLAGKIGQDLLLLCQTEVGELRFAGAGRSSAMPHKTNPVQAEALVAIAAHSAGLAQVMQQTLVQRHERDGVGMTLEKLTLAPLVNLCGASFSLLSETLDAMSVDEQAMRKNLANTRGLVLAEAATVALSDRMARARARELVTEACEAAVANGSEMLDELAELVGDVLDWQALAQGENHLGSADASIDRVLHALYDALEQWRSED